MQQVLFACHFVFIALMGLAAIPSSHIFAARTANTTLRMPEKFPTVGYGLTNAFGDLTFNKPVAIASVPGETNRIFIVEKEGRVFVITNLAQPTRTEFLNVSANLIANTEGGLLGLAFHPGYATNGFFYVYATVNATLDGLHHGLHDEVARYSVDPSNPNRAVPESKLRLLIQYDNSDQHNGGDVQFGPDGYLYVGIGYEGPSLAEPITGGQSIDTHFFGCILRIDVDKHPGNLLPNSHPGVTTNYFVPADNPFVGATHFNGQPVSSDRVRTELYAVGLRNPWKFSFDGARLYAADVGGGLYEEINLIEPGGNYGWPYVEGPRWRVPMPPPTQAPFYSYFHGTRLEEGWCVIGGSVYRGDKIPQLRSAYVFGDFVSGRIWALRHTDSDVTGVETLATAEHVAGTPSITSFGTDPSNGDILVADYDGQIRRLIYVAPESVSVPVTLAETGAFSDVGSLTPQPGIVPFDVAVPFWSDNAIKKRWFSIPDPAAAMQFHPTTNWLFPPGAVWIKHFELEMTKGVPGSRRRIETRFIVKNPEGVYGVTYRWGNSNSNAVLVGEGGMEETFTIRDGPVSRTQIWTYPSRNGCLKCHNAAAGYVLGFNTPQMNCLVTSGGASLNQIELLNSLGYFSNTVAQVHQLPVLAHPTNAIAPIQDRARSYLNANCSACHNPDGPLAHFWNARITSPMADARIIEGHSFTGPAGYKIIKPRDPDYSILLHRISADYGRMPPLASTELDRDAIELLTEYVEGLPGEPWKAQDIGAIGREGSSSIFKDVYSVSGAGANIGGPADAFHYLSRPFVGNGQFIARVLSTETNARAGIMFRDSATSNGPFAMLSFDAGGTVQWIHRVRADDDATAVVIPNPSRAEWLRVVRENSLLRAYVSSGGNNWSSIGEATIDWGSNATMGLAISSLTNWRTATASFNKVSGLSVQLSSAPASPVSITEPIELTANVSAFGEQIAKVEFYDGADKIGQAMNPPYRIVWDESIAGEHVLMAKAVTVSGEAVSSAAVFVQRLLPPTRLADALVNTTTRGNWPGVFGREGFLIAGDSTNLPPHVTCEVAVATVKVHAKSTPQARALRRRGRPGRRAASLTSPASFTVNATFPDGRLHRLALYFVDWEEPHSRVQLVEVFDAATGALLNSQTISKFKRGIYLTYTLRGAVQVRITRVSGRDPVLSGIFIDPAQTDLPSIQITSPAHNRQFTLPAEIAISMMATDSDGIELVELFANGTKIGEKTDAPFVFGWPIPTLGTHVFSARATDKLGATKESNPVSVRAVLPNSVAQLLRVDTNTQGSWIGTYGADGYAIAAHATNFPGYASVVLGGQAGDFFLEGNPREMQTTNGEGRVLSYWAADGPTSLKFTDGREHVMAIYFMDVQKARSQRFTIRDADTQQLLHTSDMASFADGRYLVFRVRGHLQLDFNALSGPPPVFSALFFAPLPPAPSPLHGVQLAPSVGLVNDRLTFRVLRSKTAPSSSVVIEISDDLLTWLPADGEVIEIGATDWGDFVETAYSLARPIEDAQSCFIRLKVN